MALAAGGDAAAKPSDGDVKAEAPAPALAKKQRKGILSRMWRGVFGPRSDDYEKKLQRLSREEAAVQARMKRRAMSSRRMARNLIFLSVAVEVVAVAYAIMATRSVELNWQMRAVRVLPIFLLPGLSSVIYSTLLGFTRMFDRKDQKTLDRLRAETKAKIDELKERTNYYTTQQLIQRYDLDPAAKAAAATVLASKLGEDSGLKMYLGDESKANAQYEKNNDVELVQSSGLRNRKPVHARNNSTGGTMIAQIVNETSVPDAGGQDAIFQGQKIVEHLRGSGSNDGGWIARIAALLVGEDPSQSYALICGNCHMHNGLIRKEDFPYITYYCPHCHALNRPRQSGDQESDSSSGKGNPSSGGTNPSCATNLNSVTGSEVKANKATARELPVEAE